MGVVMMGEVGHVHGGGGRRWHAVYWLAAEPAGDGLDRVGFGCTGLGRCSGVFDRVNEYRLVWDGERGMWRMDRRTHAEGG